MRHWMDRMSEWRLDDFGGSVNNFKQVGIKSAAVDLNLEQLLKNCFSKLFYKVLIRSQMYSSILK